MLQTKHSCFILNLSRFFEKHQHLWGDEKMSVIEVNNLSKTFGKRKVIDDISFSVEEGDIFGFLGQNGSGKTTTIRMLLDLIHPDAGEVKLNSYNIKQDYYNAIKQVGAIVETPKFYPYLTARKNLNLMANLIPGIKSSRVDEVLDLVDLSDRADDKVRTYSLGMNQRLGIANALLCDPKLVILDEPTNGLDPEGLKDIRSIITSLAQSRKTTFFISTHLLSEVEQICNKVAILHGGKILVSGNVQELLRADFEVLYIYTSHFDELKECVKVLDYIQAIGKFERGAKIKVERGHSAQLNRYLILNNIDIEYLIPRTQSLESYFINLTKGENDLD